MKEACSLYGFSLVITADHGNAEDMLDLDPATGETRPKTSHSTRPVPLNVYVPSSLGLEVELTPEAKVVDEAGLQDVAPTVLALMGLGQPQEMSGRAMVKVRKVKGGNGGGAEEQKQEE